MTILINISMFSLKQDWNLCVCVLVKTNKPGHGIESQRVADWGLFLFPHCKALLSGVNSCHFLERCVPRRPMINETYFGGICQASFI